MTDVDMATVMPANLSEVSSKKRNVSELGDILY